MLKTLTDLQLLLTLVLTATYLADGKELPILGCSIGQQQVISYNNSLLSPTNITATNQDVNINPDDYLFHRNNVPLRLWCSQPLSNRTNQSRETATLVEFLSSTNKQGQDFINIDVNLTRPALITQIGSSGFSNGFVSNFSVIYATEDNSTVYRQSNLANGQEFIVPKIDTVFTLEQPFIAQWLQFLIKDGIISPSGRLCWHLTLFGCPTEDIVTRQPPHIKTMSSQPATTPAAVHVSPSQVCSQPHTQHTSSASITTPITTPITTGVIYSPVIMETPTLNTIIVKDYQILVIVIPAAVITVLIVVCIVAIGVCICLGHHGNGNGWKNHRSTFKGSQVLSTSSNTLRIVDNGTLYKSSSPLLSLTTAEGRGISEPRDDGLHVAKPIYENVAREPLPSKESGYYEPINPISDESYDSGDSMVDNPTYSIPFPVGTPRPSLGQPRPPLPPIPVPSSMLQWGQSREGGQRQSVINMVDNECYRAPDHVEDMEMSISQSFSNRLPNDYETPL